jgi:hypothetical protein
VSGFSRTVTRHETLMKSAAAEQALAAGPGAATLRVVPDEARHRANSERSASLRDLVRREVWTELR